MFCTNAFVMKKNKISGFSAAEILVILSSTIMLLVVIVMSAYVFNIQQEGKITALKANKIAQVAIRYISYNYYTLTNDIPQGSYEIINSSELFKDYYKDMVPMYGYLPCLLVKKDNYYIEPYLFFVKPPNTEVPEFKKNVAIETIRSFGLSSGIYYNGVVHGSGRRWYIKNVPSMDTCNGAVTNYSPVISLNLFDEGLNKNFRDLIPKQNGLLSSKALGTKLGDQNDYNTMKANWYMYEEAPDFEKTGNFKAQKIVFNSNNNLGIRSTHEDDKKNKVFINDNRVVRVETSDENGKNVKIANFVTGTFRSNRHQHQGDPCTREEIGQMASGIVDKKRITGLLICSFNPILCKVNTYKKDIETCWLETYPYSIRYHVRAKYLKCPQGFYLELNSIKLEPARPTRAPDIGCDYDWPKTRYEYAQEDVATYNGVAAVMGVYGQTHWHERPNGTIPHPWCNWEGDSENGAVITEATCTNDSTEFVYIGKSDNANI